MALHRNKLKTKTKLLINRRFFLRAISDEDGNESVMTSTLSVTTGTDDGKPYGRLSGTIGFRDCSNCVSFDFYSSKRKKHMLRQLNMLYRIKNTIDQFINTYEYHMDLLLAKGLIK